VKNKFFFKKKLSNIYKSPSRFSEVTSQILYGEKFKILSKNKNWLKIKTSFDNYIGYMRNNNYMDNYKPTHKIFKLKSKIFQYSKFKKFYKTENFLPFGSKILIINKNKKFIEYEKNKWIQKKDLKTIDHVEKDYIKILKLFLKTKYIWGGKTYKGVDCSAILQLFFYYNGKFYPRDTKDQIRYSKKNSKMQKFKKGDIIFWNGHVALCLDASKLIHAYGPKKKVLIMPINYTIKKIKKTANLTVKKISNILN
jgi:gamma-D-glutamyl-L-lysine dipeptidyl-peptidase